ncbi:carbohydrate kinase family protein [Streptomyces capoamus]|uniref:carbohydrate kinase family protein n=1 Tax=Streptomyces capoamus TaxID=68183 RepID=UPI003391C789
MRIAVTGSIATDHLMTFPGRFTEQLVPDLLDTVSLSFLVDGLDVRYGGVAANIAYGLGKLGLRPVMVGAAGKDFAEYGQQLTAAGVDTSFVRISETLLTARFLCTTDHDHNQIAAFYPGAMTEAADIDLAALIGPHRRFHLVLIGADDPAAMLRHTQACRDLGIPFAADPSQQLARLDRDQLRRLVNGARFLFTNAYENALLRRRTGWGTADVLGRVGAWITTRGADGVTIEQRDGPTLWVPAVPTTRAVDPTGVGDAFRAGFLTGLAHHRSPAEAARLGCALATRVLETTGSQEYDVRLDSLVAPHVADGPAETRAEPFRHDRP